MRLSEHSDLQWHLWAVSVSGETHRNNPCQENKTCLYLPLRCQSCSTTKCLGSFLLISLPLGLELTFPDHTIMEFIAPVVWGTFCLVKGVSLGHLEDWSAIMVSEVGSLPWDSLVSSHRLVKLAESWCHHPYTLANSLPFHLSCFWRHLGEAGAAVRASSTSTVISHPEDFPSFNSLVLTFVFRCSLLFVSSVKRKLYQTRGEIFD